MQVFAGIAVAMSGVLTGRTRAMLERALHPWRRMGPMRMVYLQYVSAPVTFFEPQALYRRPEWMQEPRGRDVSPDLT
jgi:uncharacterized membrane protein